MSLHNMQTIFLIMMVDYLLSSEKFGTNFPYPVVGCSAWFSMIDLRIVSHTISLASTISEQLMCLTSSSMNWTQRINLKRVWAEKSTIVDLRWNSSMSFHFSLKCWTRSIFIILVSLRRFEEWTLALVIHLNKL